MPKNHAKHGKQRPREWGEQLTEPRQTRRYVFLAFAAVALAAGAYLFVINLKLPAIALVMLSSVLSVQSRKAVNNRQPDPVAIYANRKTQNFSQTKLVGILIGVAVVGSFLLLQWSGSTGNDNVGMIAVLLFTGSIIAAMGYWLYLSLRTPK